MAKSRCGLDCGACKYGQSAGCPGCAAIPDPFWGRCPVKGFCEGRGLEHCGLCPDFVCGQLHAFAYDMGEESDGGARLDRCRRWAGGKE